MYANVLCVFEDVILLHKASEWGKIVLKGCVGDCGSPK